MVRLAKGEVYKAERVRSGNSPKGEWELIVVKNGKDELALWPTKVPSGVTEGGEFRIESIENVTKKKVAYKDGKLCKDRSVKDVEWRTEVDLNATVTPVGFSEAPFDFDDPPFMFDDNPFDSDDTLPL